MRGELFVMPESITNWLICTYFAKMLRIFKIVWKPHKAYKLPLLPLGAKPKGGSVPKCSLLASNSKLKSVANQKVEIRFCGLLGPFLKNQ
ncbi:hypothetical protein CWO07_17710 [Vibrio splendidus]|uniref:Uncharacterized protein n=1 Tax=Vibrio splendidus TaxID=29497 RepID=A0A2T5ESG1_VIBSP|nr:hypothetical protein CWO07_17710 [Vibrio splendidus]